MNSWIVSFLLFTMMTVVTITMRSSGHTGIYRYVARFKLFGNGSYGRYITNDSVSFWCTMRNGVRRRRKENGRKRKTFKKMKKQLAQVSGVDV